MKRADTHRPVDPRDWHPADIQAALKKAGWSLRRLSMAHGYAPNWTRHAFAGPYPHVERVIAEACGIPAHVMWPSRYTHDGQPLGRGEVRKRQGPRHAKAQPAPAGAGGSGHAGDSDRMHRLPPVRGAAGG